MKPKDKNRGDGESADGSMKFENLKFSFCGMNFESATKYQESRIEDRSHTEE
jgi:hypothetical protein